MDVYKMIMKLERPVCELPTDFTVPGYLEKDIRELVNGINKKDLHIACLLEELQGSINMAILSGAISEEQAECLKDYYMNGGIFWQFH